MPKTISGAKAPSTKSSNLKQEKSSVQINSYIEHEITKIVKIYGVD